MKSDEKETTTNNNFSHSHTTIPTVAHTNPYLDLILMEVIRIIKRHKEIESNEHSIIIRRFNSVLFGNPSSEYVKKELYRIWLFIRCLIDLIVNKTEIIGCMVNEMCENEIMESKENDSLCNAWVDSLSFALEQPLQLCVKLFNPQSTQITFLTESCYELRKKSIYDLKNIITKFILGEKKKYTLSDVHPLYIDGIEEFLEIYTYPLQDTLVNIVKEYWTCKLPKLINEETNTLKVTPEISKFTEEVLQFHINFYKKINEEFENFECKGVNEKNNIIPFIYYYLSTAIIKSLSYIIIDIYVKLFYRGQFTNWHTFAKFFIYPLYEIYDNFCEKLIIDENNNKFKLYKYFSNCNNERLITLIRYWVEINCSLIYHHTYHYINVPLLEKQDQEWVYIKNKLLQNKEILEEWIDYFKKFQS